MKTHADIRTEADLQNMVSGTILRQSAPFTQSDLMDQIVRNIEGSPLLHVESTADEFCARTIKYLELSGCLRVTLDPKSGRNEYRLAVPFAAPNAQCVRVG